MNDNEVIFEPAAIDLQDENCGYQGWIPMVNVYFTDGSVGLITSPERYATQALALLAAIRIADAQRERITTLYREGVA